MSDYRDHRDEQRHRNLRRIAVVTLLPQSADESRQARWRRPRLAPDGDANELGNYSGAVVPPTDIRNKKGTFMRRHRTMVFAGSGIAAAIVAVALILVASQPRPVSAATIFRDLAAALSRSLTIEIENVDYGNARIDGQILYDRDNPADGESRYAEFHVLLRPDNPAWEEVDGVCVVCDTPDAGWAFVYPNGGQHLGGTNVKFLSALYTTASWEHFGEDPARLFPGGLGFGGGDEKVMYTIPSPQRDAVRALLSLLLDLSAVQTAGEMAAELEASAGNVEVTRTKDGYSILRASQFSRLGDLKLDAPPKPDIEQLVRGHVWELKYSLERRRVTLSSSVPPSDVPATGVSVVVDSEHMPLDSPDAFLAHLREKAEAVEVLEMSPTVWRLRVTGYPFETSTAVLDWLTEYVERLKRELTLEVVYDNKSQRVESAEFRGFTGPDSRVRLIGGAVDIDPAWLDSDRWVTDLTMKY